MECDKATSPSGAHFSSLHHVRKRHLQRLKGISVEVQAAASSTSWVLGRGRAEDGVPNGAGSGHRSRGSTLGYGVAELTSPWLPLSVLGCLGLLLTCLQCSVGTMEMVESAMRDVPTILLIITYSTMFISMNILFMNKRLCSSADPNHGPTAPRNRSFPVQDGSHQNFRELKKSQSKSASTTLQPSSQRGVEKIATRFEALRRNHRGSKIP